MEAIQRKTRFVCISDTHNASPAHGAFKLPRGDVLIHAGDMTNQGSLSELRKTVDWIEQADFEAKIVIAGNHDVTLDADFYAQHGSSFHNQRPQSSGDCLELFKSSPSITYLNHESAIVKLKGPGTVFKIFGSPYSPAFGCWGFGYDSTEEALHLWNQIPMDTDVVVTHGPPKFHCDETQRGRSVGCEVLRQTLWRVRPRLSVCGHIHEARGAERILWDLHGSNVKYRELNTKPWIDPGQNNKKQSLIDLTARGGAPLDYEIKGANEPTPVTERHPRSDSSGCSSAFKRLIPFKSEDYQSPWGPSIVSPSESNPYTHPLTDPEMTDMASSQPLPSSSEGAVSYPRGQGGVPPSGPCDMEALSGRMGRKETCVINAAIKPFNKPIVVDIDLPVWRTAANDIIQTS